MTRLKKRLIFIFCLLLFLGLDRFAGRHLFGDVQMVVEILFIFLVGGFVFYWAVSDEHISGNCASEVGKRKRELLALLRANDHKQKFKDFMRRILPK
jgi:hypothetical protein